MEKLEPIHPGQVLHHDYLEPMKLSQRQLAFALNVPPNRINAIVRGTRGISGDTALRLAKYFGTAPGLWMNLQKEYEMDLARQQSGKEIKKITPMKTGEY